ncbi:MAG: dihydropteroate synthase [Dehalococcoidia bacterium]|nr:dihydropteroate synthase [Dehalococcoidia bacterium]
MTVPPLRVIPPAPGQLAADSGAPAVGLFGVDVTAVVATATALGLPAAGDGELGRVVAGREGLALLAARLTEAGLEAGARLQRYLRPAPAWRLRTRSLPLDRPVVMGIVNLTEDSFSGDGVGRSLPAALRRAEQLRKAGAAVVDVGAETARADRPALDAAEEAPAVAAAVAALVREGHLCSVDTYKPDVARAALAAGAEAVNDISGLTLGGEAAVVAAEARAGYVLNYSYSVPKQRPPSPPVYIDVVAETLGWLFARLARLPAEWVAAGQVAIDPGVAFGKSHDEDLQVLRRLGEYTSPGLPLMLAHSRKNFIASVSGLPPEGRDLETQVAAALAYAQGARVFRVHDVAGARRALELAAAIVSAPPGAFAPGAESWPWRAGAVATHMTRLAPDRLPPPGQRW